MEKFQQMFLRQLKYILYLLSLYTLGWGFTAYKTFFLSLILGTVISIFMLWSLTRKIDKLGQAVLERKKVRTIGTLSRLALAALAAAVALEYPQYFAIVPVVLGLMTSYIVIIIDFLLQKWKNNGQHA
ncbi:ATP synthase subunit I [Saccharococcus caldoxylosilyticus]|jgi:ATP synthase protein I|uniref:ATP synthase protein I n=1 Tax=Parageobacillus caldoxylosilyticus NBRC 107762 TaxID=1220594 RepID=A0A023DBR9_9BACL|nr:ATP synthase subunit I [Parageobacillus caldoxylosilyticus]OQP04738.1 ATP synthase subunit I [Geobacillus sp. 44B]MBB3851128.1 ATP synthase protein I [Parageobacillus caldoxylosilyticus]QNU38822.1 ATP synthase subunit I [Geobacillus sp. 44B]QXJ38587.1 ATP synthase I chain [Parageobacillus caldoxylosilyticus]BDG37707.1 ATP synthase subunit I [Parageobacillus caldoxylosilyticus]